VESRPPLVPYNESPLTRLLKDALTGGARLLVLACLSAEAADTDASLDTLGFAQGCRSLTAAPKARMRCAWHTLFILVALSVIVPITYAVRHVIQCACQPKSSVTA